MAVPPLADQLTVKTLLALPDGALTVHVAALGLAGAAGRPDFSDASSQPAEPVKSADFCAPGCELSSTQMVGPKYTPCGLRSRQ
jgi:hypothetical protein